MKRVEEFHDKSKLAVNEKYTADLFNFRVKLIGEEFKELFQEAFNVQSAEDDEEKKVALENYLKELCDVLYVLYGQAISFGWDLEEAFNRVHESNMSKTPFTKDSVGKIVKGDNYKPPTMEGLIDDISSSRDYN